MEKMPGDRIRSSSRRPSRIRFQQLLEKQEPSKTYRHLEKVFNTYPCIYGFMFISIITYDVAVCSNDWLLFRDINSQKQGLVYGQVHPWVRLILMCACGIGTLILLFEVLNLLRDAFIGKPWADVDLVSAIVVWFDDVPMVSLNFVICLCHNEPVSYFQLTRAIFLIISVILRIINPLLRAFVNKTPLSGNERFRRSVYKVLTTIGLCLLLCGSVTIFIFTHIIATDERKFQFRLPQEIWEGEFAYKTYFTDVGIYFHHNDLRYELNDQTEKFWIKLADIDEFYNTNSIFVKLSYTETNRIIQKLTLSSYNITHQRYRECYQLKRNENGTFRFIYTNCSKDFIQQTENPEKMVFQFLFIRPHLHLVLGDISYNVKYVRNSVCYNLHANKTNIYNNNGQHPVLMGRLLYLKHETAVVDTYRLVERNMSSQQPTSQQPTGSLLYDADHFLLEADAIWKTGMYGCQCTGKHGPTMNSLLHVSC